MWKHWVARVEVARQDLRGQQLFWKKKAMMGQPELERE
jgi:hypothetical protein